MAFYRRTRIHQVAAFLYLPLVLAGCQSAPVAPSGEQTRIADDIVLRPLDEGVWVHTTWRDLPNYGRVPANGLLIVDGDDAMLIDLPWTDEQTGRLFDWVVAEHGAAVKTVVPTHWHEDSMGGLAEAHRRGAISYGHDETVAIANQKGLPVPHIPFWLRIAVRSGKTVVHVSHFGAGHTMDNIVAWLPRERTLFGGCLIKALDAPSLGNTRDGDLAEYPVTLRKVQAEYRNARIVVPGHGDWGGPELIEHTLELCATRP